jgi:hypothetical protein
LKRATVREGNTCTRGIVLGIVRGIPALVKSTRAVWYRVLKGGVKALTGGEKALKGGVKARTGRVKTLKGGVKVFKGCVKQLKGGCRHTSC